MEPRRAETDELLLPFGGMNVSRELRGSQEDKDRTMASTAEYTTRWHDMSRTE